MSSHNSQQTANETYAHELTMAVKEQLGGQIRSLAIEVTDAGIILKGSCDTYYSKQLAQEVVGRHTSRLILSNLIVVYEAPEA